MAEKTVPAEFGAAEPPTEVEEAEELVPKGLYARIRCFVEGVRDNFTVRTVYGEPIEAHDVTVVPVAQTYFGFGVGAGVGSARRRQDEGGKQDMGRGAGGGGGGVVRPIGFIEITAAGARWVPITRPWQRAAVSALPTVIALLAGRAVGRRLRQLPAPDEV